MNSIYFSRRVNKLISIMLIMLIVALIAFLIFSIFDSKGNTELLGEITDQEINNVSLIFYANKSTNNGLAMVGLASEIPPAERYFTLYDFDDTDKYIYIEYNSGGFAIYDRQGEFIYEKSDIGKGPFDKYDVSDKIYYGGPSYYYVKNSQGYKHLVTNNIIDSSEADQFSSELDNIRQDYIGESLSELSLRSVESTVYEKLFLLGDNLNDEKEADSEFKLNVQMYFTLKGLAESYGGFENADTLQIWNMNTDTPYKYPFIDVFNGNNKYGSCGYVSLSTVMLYYDRLGMANMINNRSNWHLMYDYYFQTTNPVIGAFLQQNGNIHTGYISNIPNTYLMAEFLHQELIYLQYPELRGASSYNSKSFLSNSITRKQAYNKYCATNGVTEYNYIIDTGTFKLPEKIVNGNPCIVSLTNAPYIGTDSHAAVAYAFNGTKPLWYTVSSIICDYGWDRTSSSDPIYAAISVNANFINSNECLKVKNY